MMRILVAVVIAGGCAHDVHRRMAQATPGDPVGSIELVLTHPSPDVIVAVNGVLVVDGANTSFVRIDGVSSGYADIAIAMGGAEKRERVWVDEGRATVIPMGSTGGSPWDSVKNMAMSLAGIALYMVIREQF
jgi:hypothetical protein